MSKRTLRDLLAASAAILVASGAAAAQYPDWADTPEEQKGYDIARESDQSDNGFGDTVVEATMTLRNAAGQETQRSLSFTTLERADETVGDKSLVVFNSPRDVEGTALLSHAQLLDQDDQWLYLPALKRVRRISSANKSGPFLGSEFAFEDFTSLELGKYSYQYLRDDTIEQDGETFAVHVVERYPLYERSGYTRQISHIDTQNKQLRRVEFFDRQDAPLKTLDLLDYREYDGGFWRSHDFRMVNLKTGKETDIVYTDYAFQTGLNDNDFTKGVLERIR